MRRLFSACALSACLLGGMTAAAQERRPVTYEDLATLKDLDGLSVSPDGNWAAVQVRQARPKSNNYDLSWHVVSIATGEVRRIADGGEPILSVNNGHASGTFEVAPAVWDRDGRSFYYIRQVLGRAQLWSASVEADRPQQITNIEADVAAVASSGHAAELLVRTRPSAEQIEAALAEEGRFGFLFDGRYRPNHSPTPTFPKPDALAARVGPKYWSVALHGGKTRPVNVGEELGAARIFDATESAGAPESAVLVSAFADGFSMWADALDPLQRGWLPPRTIVARRATGEVVACRARECTGLFIAGIWRRSANEVVFAEHAGNRNDGLSLYSWQVGESAARKVITISGGALTPNAQRQCAFVGAEFVCLLEEPTRPQRLVAINADTGSVRTLFQPNSDFEGLDLGEMPRKVSFKTPSGLSSYGYLVLPPGGRSDKPLPLVIVTYRCAGFIRGGSGDEYPIFALAAKGVAVLCLHVPEADYQRAASMDISAYEMWSRGPGDPEKQLVQEILEHLVDELAAGGVVDPGRVAVTGLSFGSEIAVYALFNMQLAAAITSGGEISPSTTFLYTKDARQRWKVRGFDSPESARWNELSIVRNVDRVCAPLLINASDRELVLRLEMFVALERVGRPVEMHVHKDEYHIKRHPRHRLAIYERNGDWLLYWLLGVTDPSPEKRSQFDRWRLLQEELNAAHTSGACR